MFLLYQFTVTIQSHWQSGLPNYNIQRRRRLLLFLLCWPRPKEDNPGANSPRTIHYHLRSLSWLWFQSFLTSSSGCSLSPRLLISINLNSFWKSSKSVGQSSFSPLSRFRGSSSPLSVPNHSVVSSRGLPKRVGGGRTWTTLHKLLNNKDELATDWNLCCHSWKFSFCQDGGTRNVAVVHNPTTSPHSSFTVERRSSSADSIPKFRTQLCK